MNAGYKTYERVYEKISLPKSVIKDVIDTFLETLIEDVYNEGEVTLNKFGRFRFRKRKFHDRRIDQELYQYYVSFKLSQSIRGKWRKNEREQELESFKRELSSTRRKLSGLVESADS